MWTSILNLFSADTIKHCTIAILVIVLVILCFCYHSLSVDYADLLTRYNIVKTNEVELTSKITLQNQELQKWKTNEQQVKENIKSFTSQVNDIYNTHKQDKKSALTDSILSDKCELNSLFITHLMTSIDTFILLNKELAYE